jgi:sugar/nucleoside kinase (ribokinase family)
MMIDVGCAGILVADTFCGPMKRLPHPGELLALAEMPSKAGGCAANVAIDLAKQGFAVDVCGCVGADPSAEVLLQPLSAAGAGCRQVRRLDSHPTSKTVIVLVEGEDRRYLHVFGANAAFNIGQIPRAWIDSLRVFYLGGLLVMPAVDSTELAELLAYCRGRGIRTVVDVVVPHDYSGMKELAPILPHVDYFLPNDDEAQRLTGEADPERQIGALLKHGTKNVIVTRGNEGSIAGSGSKRWQAGTYHVDSIDPTGAGDAFAAGVITGILRGWDMGQSLRYGAALGASATMAIGTTDGVFTAEAGEAYIDRHPLAVAESAS